MIERADSARRVAGGAAATLFASGVLAWVTADAAQAACLKANAQGQVAEGRLVTGRFKDAAGRREDAYIVELTVPVCLAGDDENDQVKATRRIHVYPQDDKLGAALRRLVGRTVRITASPFGQHTVHHHAPIVMGVAAVAAR
jgi:hypothetical protein